MLGAVLQNDRQALKNPGALLAMKRQDDTGGHVHYYGMQMALVFSLCCSQD